MTHFGADLSACGACVPGGGQGRVKALLGARARATTNPCPCPQVPHPHSVPMPAEALGAGAFPNIQT